MGLSNLLIGRIASSRTYIQEYNNLQGLIQDGNMTLPNSSHSLFAKINKIFNIICLVQNSELLQYHFDSAEELLYYIERNASRIDKLYNALDTWNIQGVSADIQLSAKYLVDILIREINLETEEIAESAHLSRLVANMQGKLIT